LTTENDTSLRLKRLEAVLAQAGSRSLLSSESDAADVHLDSVLVDRIRQLTAELRERDGAPIDDIDALAMRLLLNEYRAAVGHLRAVARIAAERIDAAPRALKDARRAVHRLEKAVNKREAPGAGS
jgi:hypothetical protein